MADLMDVSPSPQSIVLSTPTYLLRDHSVCRPNYSVRLGGGGVGVLIISPSHTASSVVISFSAYATSPTKSCAVLSLRVPMFVKSAPVPVSPVGYLLSDAIKFSLVVS